MSYEVWERGNVVGPLVVTFLSRARSLALVSTLSNVKIEHCKILLCICLSNKGCVTKAQSFFIPYTLIHTEAN